MFHTKLIGTHMISKDIPKWYRGISNFQSEAASKLLYAIRDDVEQQTAHRVQYCLFSLGLEPMVTKRDIKLLMRLSQGNDLAFLWFLMEMRYKDPNKLPNEYSINEQIIMSSMVVLDMVTTLRELDRMLPPSSMSKKEWEKRRKLEELDSRPKRVKKPPKQYSSPYFQPLVRPKEISGCKVGVVPDFRYNFGEFEIYKNIDYVPPNEANRWYANYVPREALRIVNGILKHFVIDLFDNYQTIKERVHSKEMLCEFHKIVKEKESLLRIQKEVLAKEKLLEYLDVEKDIRKARQHRIRAMLEDAVREITEKLKTADVETKSDKMIVGTVTKNSSCHFQLMTHDGDLNEADKNNSLDASKKMQSSVDKKTRNSTTGQLQDIPADKCDELPAKETDKTDKISVNSSCSAGYIHLIGKPQPKHIPDVSESYFRANTINRPYVFNYPKIFNFENRNTEKRQIKKAIFSALDCSTDFPESIPTSKIDLGAPVGKCFKQMWGEGLKEHEIEMKRIEEMKPIIDDDVLKYDCQYFDPDDNEFMLKMLKDAFNIMKKNPKFVLASMPDAHKVPILRHWIADRYGFKNKRSQVRKDFSKCVKLYRLLEKYDSKLVVPNIHDMSEHIYVDYTCWNYVMRKAKQLKNEYTAKLKKRALRQARTFWFITRPYQSPNGPPRNTFFAYMPAHEKNILHYRTWRLCEFRNVKKAWDSRMIKKSKEPKW